MLISRFPGDGGLHTRNEVNDCQTYPGREPFPSGTRLCSNSEWGRRGSLWLAGRQLRNLGFSEDTVFFVNLLYVFMFHYFPIKLVHSPFGEKLGLFFTVPWLHMAHFHGRFFKEMGSLTDPGTDSVGVLDLGGASMQITFVPEADRSVLQHSFPLFLQGRQSNLYSAAGLSFFYSIPRRFGRGTLNRYRLVYARLTVRFRLDISMIIYT